MRKHPRWCLHWAKFDLKWNLFSRCHPWWGKTCQNIVKNEKSQKTLKTASDVTFAVSDVHANFQSDSSIWPKLLQSSMFLIVLGSSKQGQISSFVKVSVRRKDKAETLHVHYTRQDSPMVKVWALFETFHFFSMFWLFLDNHMLMATTRFNFLQTLHNEGTT